MSDKHLKPESHRVNNRCWWYEEEEGISIVVEHTDEKDKYNHTELYLIPWKDIRASLKRKDKV